jgi:hypothetical protein
MKSTGSKLPPQKHLRILAREFRGTTDERERASIARVYAQVVIQMIGSKKKWRTIPPLEDQLPDEWMPVEFFKYWSLRPPVRRAGRTG